MKAEDIVDPELVTLEDGTKQQVSKITTTTYTYDQQGRISKVREDLLGGDYRIISYSYTSTALYIVRESLANLVSNQVSVTYDTLPLNERGLITRSIGPLHGPLVLSYNANDQVICDVGDIPVQTYEYTNGNLIQRYENAYYVQRNGQWVPTDYLLKQYQYELGKPNLPLIYQFEGKLSRNLPVEELWQMQQSAEFPNGPVYRKVFLYQYDQQGRVARRISHGKALRADWLIEDDTYGLGVTDYQYECK